DGPHRQAVVGHLDLLPVPAAVGAAIGSGLRAGIDDLGFLRMHRQGTHRRLFWQAALYRMPFPAAVGQPEKTGMHDPAAPGFTRQAEIEVGWLLCHGIARPPPVSLPGSLAIPNRFGKA